MSSCIIAVIFGPSLGCRRQGDDGRARPEVTHWCRRRESNPHCSDPKSDLSACWSTPAPVAGAPRFRERMAVRTHDTEVREPVVRRIAVDGVEREWERLPAPCVYPSHFAPGFAEAFVDETPAQAATVEVRRVGDQDVTQGTRLEARGGAPSGGPALPGEVIGVQLQPAHVGRDVAVHAAVRLIPEPPGNL